MKDATRELSRQYREGSHSLTKELKQAYVTTRMPATLGVMQKVLSQVSGYHSILDLGGGPGTSYFATGLETITIVEKDREWKKIAEELGCKAEWVASNLLDDFVVTPHDLVLLSYVINELPTLETIAKKAWDLSNQYIVVIEPGTPTGFNNILAMRNQFISLGGHIVAPCPHVNACPSNWCHFAERINRTSAHRQAKSAELGYEDEKYAYLIISKKSAPFSQPRIVRHPIKRSGHVIFSVCTENGIEQKIVSRKEKERYKVARKAKWGDVLCSKDQSLPS